MFTATQCSSFHKQFTYTHHLPYKLKRLHFPGFESLPGQDVFPYSKNSTLALGWHPVCYSMGTGVVSRGLVGRGLMSVTCLLLKSRLMTGAIPLLHLYTSAAWSGTALLLYLHNLGKLYCVAFLLQVATVDGVRGTVWVCCDEMTSYINTVWAKCRVFKVGVVCIAATVL